MSGNKNDIASELRTLAELLNQHSLCEDTSPLYKAEGGCIAESTDKEWKYSISKLIFRIPTIGHTIPNSAEEISLSFSIKINGLFVQNSNVIENPLNGLEFNIELVGSYIDASNNFRSLMSAWHLDKHITHESEELTKFLHPEYHMTFGGRKMWNMPNYDYGQSLILPTPRLFHPPMDGVLGIDFVLHNYFKLEKHKVLTESAKYKNIIKNAQERLWRPYYLSIAQKFNNFTNIQFMPCISAKILVPNLIH